MGRKTKWVPEVLWRLFGGRSQTLAEAILSLIPVNCHCYDRRQIKFGSKSKCMHCCFNANYGSARGYLIRSDDPPDYLNLLYRSFVVVSNSAPPLPHRSSSDRRWSQRQIVKRTIETKLSVNPSSSNVICSGFDKAEDSSFIVQLLSSSAWKLVLRRIGDSIMYYLLMYSSIFVPLPHGSHQQVTGPPVNVSFREPSGSQKKRSKRTEATHPLKSDDPLASSKFVIVDRHKSQDCTGLNRDLECVSSKLCSTETPVTIMSSGANSKGEVLNSNEDNLRPKKRKRLPSWQRKRLRQSRVQDEKSENASSETPVTITSFGANSKGEELNSDEANLRPKKRKRLPRWQRKRLRQSRVQDENSENASSERCQHKGSSAVERGHDLPGHGLKEFVENQDDTKPENVNKAQPVFCSHVIRARHCKQTRLLEKHCPLPDLGKNSEEVDNIPAECHPVCLSKCYNSKDEVVSFVWAACRSLIPSALLGVPSCWRILRQNISRFIRLRRFEKFTLKQCMHKLKVSHFPILSNKTSSCHKNTKFFKGGPHKIANGPQYHNESDGDASIMQYNVLERWIFWLFSHVVVPMVQSNFYVTESENGKQELNYYRKSVWERLCQTSIHFLKGKGYKTLDRKSVEKILYHRKFGFSKLRFCPKGDGVRALANLRAASRFFKQKVGQGAKSCAVNDRYFYKKSVNFVLRDLHSVFKILRMTEPERWGSSVFDYNDVYMKLCPFLMDLKTQFKAMPFIYIVVSDVQKAFDTVDQGKLLSIVDEILTKDEYSSQRMHEVVCRKKSLWVHEHLSLTDSDCHVLGECSSSVFSRSSHGVLVNQGQRRIVRKEELYYTFSEHVKRNVLQYDKYFFLQEVGIPQGSVVSSLLCSLYYGHLERNVIAPFLRRVCSAETANPSGDRGKNVDFEASQGDRLLPPKSALLRFIDDFLFISTSKKQATSFFSRLQRGFHEYNCHMNKSKFCANFDTDFVSGIASKRLIVGDDGISFICWSGLLINSSTLEIQADYTRYLNSHLSSSLTVCWQGKPGRHLKEKCCDYMRPKCHPIFYDANINSPSTVRLNIYQSFLLAAMKFHCYVCELSSICKLEPGFYCKIIEKSVRYMFKLIKKRMRQIKPVSQCKTIAKVAEDEVIWLGLTAYIRVLQKKQSRYRELLRLLRFELGSQKGIEQSAPLRYAVDDSHSSLMWKIKY